MAAASFDMIVIGAGPGVCAAIRGANPGPGRDCGYISGHLSQLGLHSDEGALRSAEVFHRAPRQGVRPLGGEDRFDLDAVVQRFRVPAAGRMAI